MKQLATLFAISCLMAGNATASGKAHWGYTGTEAPQNWATLSPDYRACGAGKNQSPIDLNSFIEAELPPISFDYANAASTILNNGHTVQASLPAGSSMKVDGITFELKQFHFHTPSENRINAKSFPMEMHLVHADTNGNLAVVAVMFEEGSENPAIAKLWSQTPEKINSIQPLTDKVTAAELLPEDRDYYRFNGSLTTPPCTEGVRWFVMKNPIQLSAEQVDAFAQLMGHPNNRPIQRTNARPVLQ
jgi:carbonic anhydrase